MRENRTSEHSFLLKMKLLTCVLLLTTLACAMENEDGKDELEQCREEQGLTNIDMLQTMVQSGGTEAVEILGCLNKCAWEKTGLWSNGQLNLTMYIETIKESVTTEEVSEELIKRAKACANEMMKTPDECLRTLAFADCVTS